MHNSWTVMHIHSLKIYIPCSLLLPFTISYVRQALKDKEVQNINCMHAWFKLVHNIHYIIYVIITCMHAYKLYYCNTVHVIFITVHVFCIPSFMQSYFCTLCQPESPGAKSHWKTLRLCAKQVALKQGIKYSESCMD